MKLHWATYACELVGTCILVFAGLSAVTFDFAHGLPMERWVPSVGVRLLITGLLFSGTGALTAVSPIGKRSGAHINPSVTLAFWIRRTMHGVDALMYMAAQFIGGTVGAILLAAVWGPYAYSVAYGTTTVGPTFTVPVAFAAEFALTFLLVAMILLFVSSHRLMRKTPLMVWILVGMMVWLEAPISGTSLNPARSFGPAWVAGLSANQWLYFLAPPLGAAAAALLFPVILGAERKVLTGKLFHSAHYPSIFKTGAVESPAHPQAQDGR